jgi:hypothetical protein
LRANPPGKLKHGCFLAYSRPVVKVALHPRRILNDSRGWHNAVSRFGPPLVIKAVNFNDDRGNPAKALTILHPPRRSPPSLVPGFNCPMYESATSSKSSDVKAGIHPKFQRLSRSRAIARPAEDAEKGTYLPIVTLASLHYARATSTWQTKWIPRGS